MKKVVTILSIFLLLFTACTEKYNYPTVSENLSIVNLTDTSFVVEFGFMNFDTIIAKDTVNSMMNVCQYINKPIANENNLWMNEAQFNECVQTLKIYRIENNDSVLVNPVYFDNRNLWNSTMDKFIDMGVYVSINHVLEIKPEMFQQ
ncbi:MAG: hypothetical protein PHS59_15210 [Paludibacter sp.]|nr:hypothetical protein [Paludibacter sp.]